MQCDASKVGVEAVLMQVNHPIACVSQNLKGRALQLTVYEKEMLTITYAVTKWKPYLLARRFIIKTDHKSLRFLLDQRMRQEFQHPWIQKLVGYDYLVEYKKGAENKAANALSRSMADQDSEVTYKGLIVVNGDTYVVEDSDSFCEGFSLLPTT